MGLIVPAQYAGPRAPIEMRDEVVRWGQEHGREAWLEWCAPARCFAIYFRLKPDDSRLRLWQEQVIAEEPTESVLLHMVLDPPRKIEDGRGGFRWQFYEPINLADLGQGVMREILDRANTWSGNGEFDSLGEAVAVAAERTVRSKRRKYEELRQESRDVATEVRRQVLKIPLVQAGIDLKTSLPEPAPTKE